MAVDYMDLARLEEKLKRIITLTEERIEKQLRHLEVRIDDVADDLKRL